MLDRVRHWLEASGFPLEMRIANSFEASGFTVSQGDYYVDPETSIARETDIIASKENAAAPAWLRWWTVIECKAGSEAPWVLFPRRGSALDSKSRISALAVSDLAGPYLSRVARRMDMLALPAFKTSGPPAYGMRTVRGELPDAKTKLAGGKLAQGKAKAPQDKPDTAYAALMSVAKAAAFLLKQLNAGAEADESVNIVWPVIVTEAPLVEARLLPSGKMDIQSVERSTVVWRHPTVGRGLLIDIVSANTADTFIAELSVTAETLLHNTNIELEQTLTKRRENEARSQRTRRGGV